MNDSDQTQLVESLDEDKDGSGDSKCNPSVEKMEEMLTVVDESESGHQLLKRPWDKERFWQVVDPEQRGPHRIGSPNGGCLYSKSDKERARRYHDLVSSLPKDTGATSVPGYVAAAGRDTAIEWLYAYRRYDIEELAARTGLPETEIEEILQNG